jgi:hypothetical protein
VVFLYKLTDVKGLLYENKVMEFYVEFKILLILIGSLIYTVHFKNF